VARHVLLVGGDAEMTGPYRDFLTAIQRDDDYEVEGAEYCDDALAPLHPRPFDAVVLLSLRAALENVAESGFSRPTYRRNRVLSAVSSAFFMAMCRSLSSPGRHGQGTRLLQVARLRASRHRRVSTSLPAL